MENNTRQKRRRLFGAIEGVEVLIGEAFEVGWETETAEFA